MNNLLTVVVNALHTTLDTVDREDPLHERLADIHTAAQSAADLAHELHAHEVPRLRRVEALDLGLLVSGSARLLRRALGAGIRLETRAPRFLWLVPGDRLDLARVLLNLALNARDAMPDGGELRMTLSNVEAPEHEWQAPYPLPPGRYVRLVARDTGPGMPAEIAEHAFEPRFSTKHEAGGSGLGLAIVRQIVTEHGGHVHLRSGAARGLEVTLLLPAQLLDSGTVVEQPRDATAGLGIRARQ